MRHIKLYDAIERLVNLAIIMAAICLVILVYLRLRPHQPINPVTATIISGEHFPGSGLSPSPNGSLVFALQIGCHFCKESMPFYRDITRSALASGKKIVYVLPNPVEDSRNYLREQGLPDSQILQKKLQDVKVFGTPTLIFLDGTNTVKNVWIGKLDEGREKEVQNAITSPSSKS